jgi:hypothetical protein
MANLLVHIYYFNPIQVITRLASSKLLTNLLAYHSGRFFAIKAEKKEIEATKEVKKPKKAKSNSCNTHYLTLKETAEKIQPLLEEVTQEYKTNLIIFSQNRSKMLLLEKTLKLPSKYTIQLLKSHM